MLQALIELAFAAAATTIILLATKSFGAYTRRIERSNETTRTVVEANVRRIEHCHEEAERVLRSIHRLRQDLRGSDELPPMSSDQSIATPNTERSA